MYALVEGVTFAGRYRVVRSIAAGGMGAVYEVVHIETERRRALKVMHPHLMQEAEMRERFRREARVGGRVESENIVEVFDAGVDEATQMPFLVMEFLRGEELGRMLKRVGRLTAADAVHYLHQTSLALDKAHAAGVVHRDLKPDNLFLVERDDGRPMIKVLDFGIAKFLSDSGTRGAATRSLGTPLYMAPEQLRTAQGVSPRSDLYALGMVAYTLLVGNTYWYDEAMVHGEPLAFALVVLKGPPEPATARAARMGVPLPAAFDAWFARATAPNPSDRFPTAGMMIGELADALGCRPVSATGDPTILIGSAAVAGPVSHVASQIEPPSHPLIQLGAHGAPGSVSAHTSLPAATTPSGTLGAVPPTQAASYSSSQTGPVAISGLQVPPRAESARGIVFAILGLLLALAAAGGGVSLYLLGRRDAAQQPVGEARPDAPTASASPQVPTLSPSPGASEVMPVPTVTATATATARPAPSTAPTNAGARPSVKPSGAPPPTKTAPPPPKVDIHSQY